MRSHHIFLAATLGLIALGAASPATPDSPVAVQTKAEADSEILPSSVGQSDRGCARGRDIRSSDLCAQWKAADAAVDAVQWSALAAGIGGLSFVGVLAALFLAYRANGIARQSMEAQSRAWVAIDDIEPVGFRMQNGSPRFVFKTAFLNMGSTPAVRFRYFAGLAFGDDPKAHIDETLAQFRSGKIDWVECDLFPNRPLTRRVSCDHDGEPQSITATHLYVAAAYRTVFSTVERFTVVMFRIQDSRRDDHLIDYSHPPFGDHISVGSPEQFAGLVS